MLVWSHLWARIGGRNYLPDNTIAQHMSAYYILPIPNKHVNTQHVVSATRGGGQQVSRCLYQLDNLDVLRGINSNTIDLIATDPPFNKGRDFHATPESLSAGASFQDRWNWDDDIHGPWIDLIKDSHPDVWNVIESANTSYGQDMGAFLCFLGVRILEMHRVLKDTGSIYLQCDPTASHYIKTLLDAIFGKKNFRNEIVWKRKHEKHNLAKNRLPVIHDSIFWYVKSDRTTYNIQYEPYSDAYVESNYKHIDERGRYSTFPCTNDAGGNKEYEFRGIRRAWRFSPETMQRLWDDGMLTQAKPTSPFRYKKYLDTDAGIKVDDLWLNFPSPRGASSTGYPTQKPLELYERIIRASSNPGDLVLDPFAGCATTCVAAERLGRSWIGIDIWGKTHEVTLERLKRECWLATDADARPDLLVSAGTVELHEEPPVRTDSGVAAAPRLKTLHGKAKLKKMPRSEVMAALLERNGGPICDGCYIRMPHERYMEIDHDKPRHAGGKDDLSNYNLLCGPCNRLKSHRYTISGLQEQNRKAGFMVV